MQSIELMERLESGATELLLDQAVRFRRRTRSNLHCSFDEFLAALVACETVVSVACEYSFTSSITDDQRFHLVDALGRVPRLNAVYFGCGSRVPLMALAAAVSNPALRDLSFGHDIVFTGDQQEGTFAVGVSLGRSRIEDFSCMGTSHSGGWSPFFAGLNLSENIKVIRLGYDCLHTYALRDLVQSNSLQELNMVANHDDLVAIGEELSTGNSSLQRLLLSAHLSTQSLNESVKVLAKGIAVIDSLEILTVELCNGFTDEAGVDLAEAIEANTSLSKVELTNRPCDSNMTSHVGHATYRAMTKMLRARPNLKLEIPDLKEGGSLDARTGRVVSNGPGSETHTEYYKMRIQMGLNAVGVRDIMGQTNRAVWVNAFNAVDRQADTGIHEYNIHLDCLYELLSMNPMICKRSRVAA